MSLNDYRDQCWQIADAKGFHDGRHPSGRDETLIRLCFIHTEVSEAVQIVKRQGITGESLVAIANELADILIRTFDLGGCLSIDLDAFVRHKMAVNERRPHKYGTPEEGK